MGPCPTGDSYPELCYSSQHSNLDLMFNLSIDSLIQCLLLLINSLDHNESQVNDEIMKLMNMIVLI